MDYIQERVKAVRKAKKLTQTEFAAKLDEKENQIISVENSKQKAPHTLLQKIVEIFQVNGHWLLTGEGSMYLTTSSNTPLSPHVSNLIQWLQYLDKTADPQILNWLEVEIASRFPDYNEWRQAQGMNPLQKMDILTKVERFLYEKMTDEERARFFPLK